MEPPPDIERSVTGTDPRGQPIHSTGSPFTALAPHSQHWALDRTLPLGEIHVPRRLSAGRSSIKLNRRAIHRTDIPMPANNDD
ncbi:MAG: hypothetical protein CBB71_11105 [Rhodopirellula sp. TMED11]|nr:MAG: hypothetical protein CBB71_11105 [Rhodopirellula sp. TMED11]